MPEAKTWRPNRKVTSGAAIGTPAAIVIIWLLQVFAGAEIPADVAAAIGSIMVFGTSYFVPERQP